MHARTQLRRRARGFTLIEIILVLVIIATLAGLVISQVGMLGRSADMSATAKNQQDIANQIGMYFVLQKRMPTRMDSLLHDVAGAPTVLPLATRAGATTGVNAENQGWGLPLGGANGTNVHAQLVASDLAALTTPAGNFARSFTRAGFVNLVDHAAWSAGGNCNDSGLATTPRALGNSAGNCWVARVVTTTNGDTVPATAGAIVRQIYPHLDGALPDGVVALVAVGVGPSSSLIPDTMLSAPIYPGCDGSYYGRYIAYFAVFASGERAQLVGVSDSYGRFPNYSIQQFNESLPNNARQG